MTAFSVGITAHQPQLGVRGGERVCFERNQGSWALVGDLKTSEGGTAEGTFVLQCPRAPGPILAQRLTSSSTWGKLLNLSWPSFPLRENGLVVLTLQGLP